MLLLLWLSVDAMSSHKGSFTKGAGRFPPCALTIGLIGLVGPHWTCWPQWPNWPQWHCWPHWPHWHCWPCWPHWYQQPYWLCTVAAGSCHGQSGDRHYEYEDIGRTFQFLVIENFACAPQKLGKSPPKKTKVPNHQLQWLDL